MPRRLLPLILAGAGVTAGAADRVPPPPLESLLAGAARYVAAYEREFAYIVAEERYIQKLSVGVSVQGVRELRSDVAFVPLATPMRWTAFRDVYEMDGKPVADRRALLKKLFIDPASDAVVRAAEILDTSARFNLGRTRNLNIPTLALVFLHEANQPRFKFERKDDDEIEDVTGWEVAFEETASPTFVRDPIADRDRRCRGRVWLAVDGRVLRSTIVLADPSVQVEIDVRFGPWEGSKIWMPTSMTDSYTAPWVSAGSGRGASTERLVGTARYENFRRYQVHIESEATTK